MSGGHNSHHENYQCPMETKKKSYPFHSKIQTHKRYSDSYFDIQMSILFDGIVVQNAIFMCVWFVWTWLRTLCSLNSTLDHPLCILFHSNLLFFSLAKISFHNKNEWKTAWRINSPVMSPNNTKPKVLSLYASCQLCFT